MLPDGDSRFTVPSRLARTNGLLSVLGRFAQRREDLVLYKVYTLGATMPRQGIKYSGRPPTYVRQKKMLDLILHQSEVDALTIARHCNISVATVRRDLAALVRRGLIDRTWGGAKVRSPIQYLPDFQQHAEQQARAKRCIAASAASLVEPDMIVGLSGGTTCTELARWLRGKPVTVVTNAINVATELYNHARTKVIVVGGTLNSHSYELVGDTVCRYLAEYQLDLCFLGSSGISPNFGFSMRDESEAAVARAFLSVSRRAAVVADHSKVGQRTFARFAPLHAVDYLITDEGLCPQWVKRLTAEGLTVTLAPTLGGKHTGRDGIQ